ncbi:NudC domain-containing protein 2-like [Oopsacas minuta]|uniref:NudC domain-containing protein 2-like n=1 Tax=Oopsacas minuta TaxID=111878 RepID=A0AAV7JXQ9_9METZ|nr:NudC domain-containing protein 2-like [Oopsacas minuta]
MAHFDEKSGLIQCTTEWGSWAQTVEEVQITVNLKTKTSGREVNCQIKPNSIKLVIQSVVLFSGQLYSTVIEDESTWSINDGREIEIILIKSIREARNCWKSLLKDKFAADPKVFDDMEKKLTLERFHLENPGFDFSNADISGNYHKGGPNMEFDNK